MEVFVKEPPQYSLVAIGGKVFLLLIGCYDSFLYCSSNGTIVALGNTPPRYARLAHGVLSMSRRNVTEEHNSCCSERRKQQQHHKHHLNLACNNPKKPSD